MQKCASYSNFLYVFKLNNTVEIDPMWMDDIFMNQPLVIITLDLKMYVIVK